MDRVFLDANVLFSAAYRTDSSLSRLFSLPDTILLTSQLALSEAQINLDVHRPEAVARLQELADLIEVVGEPQSPATLPEAVQLPESDARILKAAIAGGATHLLTGDRRHFGELYGATVSGVLVLPPAQYLSER